MRHTSSRRRRRPRKNASVQERDALERMKLLHSVTRGSRQQMNTTSLAIWIEMAFSPRVQQPMRKAEATSQAQLERCELSLCKLHRQSSARSRYGSTERDREDAQVTERFDAVNITAAHRVQHRRLPKAAPPAEVASPVGSSPESTPSGTRAACACTPAWLASQRRCRQDCSYHRLWRKLAQYAPSVVRLAWLPTQ